MQELMEKEKALESKVIAVAQSMSEEDGAKVKTYIDKVRQRASEHGPEILAQFDAAKSKLEEHPEGLRRLAQFVDLLPDPSQLSAEQVQAIIPGK